MLIGGMLPCLVILLILSIPGDCEPFGHIVEVGDTFRQKCIKPNNLRDDAVVTRVDVLHRKVWVIRIEKLGVRKNHLASKKFDHWRVNHENIAPYNVKERNAQKVSVTFTITKVKKTDAGLLSCRMWYFVEKRSPPGRAQDAFQSVAKLYVQNEGHAPCKGKWVYYEPNRLCYKAFYRSKTWLEAKSYCADVHNGSLIDVPDHKSASFIAAVMGHREETPFWIGLNDRDKEGDFRWVDGTPTKVKLFAPGHPVTDTEKNCVEKGFHGNDKWSVLDCERANYFLCQAKPEDLANYNYGEDDGSLSHGEIMLIFLGVATATLLTVFLFVFVDQERFEKCVFCEKDKTNEEEAPPPFSFA